MARLTDKQREDIKNQLMVGESQYQVAKDFEVSTATVNKINKSLDIKEIDKVKNKVKEQVSINAVLGEQSESLVKAFDDKVNDLSKNTELIHNLTKLNLVDTENKVKEGFATINDNKIAQETIDKASITLGVNARHATTNITNTNAQQNKTLKVQYE